MKLRHFVIPAAAAFLLFNASVPRCEDDPCVKCHREVTPGHVADWETSMHCEEGIYLSLIHI